MALTAILALAVIGLAIWGFGQKSDLDDANKKVEKVENQSGSVEERQTANEKSLKLFGEKEKARYRKVSDNLISADKQNVNFKDEVAQEANALRQARSELANAKTAEEKAAAQKKVSSASTRAAISCAQGAVDALNEDSPPSALKNLEEVSKPCKTVLNGG